MKLRILDLAEADLLSGFKFYERQSAGVGWYFLDSLFAEIESLNLYAGIHRKYLGYSRMLSRRFPYAVYYRIAGDEIQVCRILDCRRDPRWIRSQLRSG
ncbi:MAG: type II toxin-antitoxin system RelE/ParE family toxin [Verrucomicrobia bacterium]|nr:type II toxin-antitoxin system RelE/ParE family toxin [Verrucomicrobiota bacterium]